LLALLALLLLDEGEHAHLYAPEILALLLDYLLKLGKPLLDQHDLPVVEID
jgi:hypothetical protein